MISSITFKIIWDLEARNLHCQRWHTEIPVHNYTSSSPSTGINLPLSISSKEFQIFKLLLDSESCFNNTFIYPQFPTEFFFFFLLFSVVTVFKVWTPLLWFLFCRLLYSLNNVNQSSLREKCLYFYIVTVAFSLLKNEKETINITMKYILEMGVKLYK